MNKRFSDSISLSHTKYRYNENTFSPLSLKSSTHCHFLSSLPFPSLVPIPSIIPLFTPLTPTHPRIPIPQTLSFPEFLILQIRFTLSAGVAPRAVEAALALRHRLSDPPQLLVLRRTSRRRAGARNNQNDQALRAAAAAGVACRQDLQPPGSVSHGSGSAPPRRPRALRHAFRLLQRVHRRLRPNAPQGCPRSENCLRCHLRCR